MVNSSTAAGIINVAIVGIIVLVLVLSVIEPQPEEPIESQPDEPRVPQPDESKFDIDKEISILNEDRPAWATFSLYEADWEESKERSEALEITFEEVEDWNEFKEKLWIQSTFKIGVDRESRVIWWGKYHVVYMYY
jgi:hypothetical protein